MKKNSRKGYPTMTKSEFIEKLVALRPNLLPNDVQETAQKIFDYMCDTLSRGERIEIRGFGSFCLRHRSPRIARNPKTREKFQLPGRSVLYFRPGKKLRCKVNEGSAVSPVVLSSSAPYAQQLSPLSELPESGTENRAYGNSSEGGDTEV